MKVELDLTLEEANLLIDLLSGYKLDKEDKEKLEKVEDRLRYIIN